LQYRENSVYGSPFLRLIRQEVEALVNEKYGNDYLQVTTQPVFLRVESPTSAAYTVRRLGPPW
jgi:hypothetical protein